MNSHIMPSPSWVQHASGGNAQFVDALDIAQDILRSQGRSLDVLNMKASANENLEEVHQLLNTINGNADEQQMLVIQMSLKEVLARQLVLEKALQTVHLDQATPAAIVGATHKIITYLDLALCCTDEVVEISASDISLQGSRAVAKEASRALRLAAQHVRELKELFGQSSIASSVVEFHPLQALDTAIARVRHAADAQAISIIVEGAHTNQLINLDRVALYKCLHCLLLAALGSTGVSKISCSIDLSDTEVVYRLKDNGRGESLEARADAAIHPDAAACTDPHSTSDGAGFAAARRLAKSLGGSIELEIWPDLGTQATLTIPI